MTVPPYYRRVWTDAAVGVAVAFVLAVALWIAGTRTVAAIRQDERAKLQQSGDALLTAALKHSATLRRERDSLAAEVAKVDTVLVTRIRRVRDTAWLPADSSPAVVLRACRSELDALAADCNAFRQAATTALAKADTSRRSDSTVIAGLSLQLAAVRRADSLKATQLATRSRWGLVARGVCVGSLAAHALTLSR